MSSLASTTTAGSVSRRSFLKGAAVAGTCAVAAGAGASAPVALADEAATASTDYAAKTAAANPENGTLKAGYLNYFDWLGEAPAITASDAAATVETDVVVVGGGNAGVCAALAAAEAGAKVAVIEKKPEDVYTFLGHDIGTLNSEYVLSQGGQQIDVPEFIQDWGRRSMNRANPELVREFAQTSGAALDWILDHVSEDIVANCGVFGVPLPTDYPGEISGYKCWSSAIHFEATEGGATDWPDAAKQLKAAAEEKSASWHFGQTAQVLIKDGSKVTGVIAQDVDGAYTLFTASKGVILAAGDYVSDPVMVFGLNDEYRNFVEARGLDWTQIVGNSGCTGDGHRMGCWAGGRMEPGPRASMGRAMGAGAFGGIALPQFNRNGKRFMNEGMLGVWGNMFQVYRQPKGTIFAVADANWREYVQKNAPEHVYPGTAGFHDGGFLATLDEEIPNVAGTGSEGYKIRGCVTYYGDTLEELADNMGLSAEVKATFLSEIERYNELCAKGVDEDFGKDGFLMDPIETAPFYASVVMDSSNFSLGLVELSGLVTDGNQQVLDADDSPIEGLYATGNCCGGRFCLQYCTPIAGISIGWATTMGKLVGETVAAL